MIQKQKAQNIVDPAYAKTLRLAIVRTDYHDEMVGTLEAKARETLMQAGVEESKIITFTAPGSWEIPLVAQTAIQTSEFDAVLAFGVIIKGETYHFEMIANECARALMDLSLNNNIPVGFEVLAVYDKKQAIARASNDAFNKGIEAANAVLKTLALIKEA